MKPIGVKAVDDAFKVGLKWLHPDQTGLVNTIDVGSVQYHLDQTGWGIHYSI